MSTINDNDIFLYQNDSGTGTVAESNRSTLDPDNDFLLVQRDGVTYRVAAGDVKGEEPEPPDPEPIVDPPDIQSVTLVQSSGVNDNRFTGNSFISAVDTLGTAPFVQQVQAKVVGNLNLTTSSSPITANNFTGSGAIPLTLTNTDNLDQFEIGAQVAAGQPYKPTTSEITSVAQALDTVTVVGWNPAKNVLDGDTSTQGASTNVTSTTYGTMTWDTPIQVTKFEVYTRSYSATNEYSILNDSGTVIGGLNNIPQNLTWRWMTIYEGAEVDVKSYRQHVDYDGSTYLTDDVYAVRINGTLLVPDQVVDNGFTAIGSNTASVELTFADDTDLKLFAPGDEVQEGVNVVSVDVANNSMVVDGGDWALPSNTIQRDWVSETTTTGNGGVWVIPLSNFYDGDYTTYAHANGNAGPAEVTIIVDPPITPTQDVTLYGCITGGTATWSINDGEATGDVYDANTPSVESFSTIAFTNPINKITITKTSADASGLLLSALLFDNDVCINNTGLAQSVVTTVATKQGLGTIESKDGTAITINPYTDNCFKEGQFLVSTALQTIVPVSSQITAYDKATDTITLTNNDNLAYFEAGDQVTMCNADGTPATVTVQTDTITSQVSQDFSVAATAAWTGYVGGNWSPTTTWSSLGPSSNFGGDSGTPGYSPQNETITTPYITPEGAFGAGVRGANGWAICFNQVVSATFSFSGNSQRMYVTPDTFTQIQDGTDLGQGNTLSGTGQVFWLDYLISNAYPSVSIFGTIYGGGQVLTFNTTNNLEYFPVGYEWSDGNTVLQNGYFDDPQTPTMQTNAAPPTVDNTVITDPFSGTGTIESVTDLDIKLSVSNDGWVSGHYMTTDAKPVISGVAYLLIDENTKQVTGYSPAPVNYTTVTGSIDLSFPETFGSTGNPPDTEFADPNAYIQTTIKLINAEGEDVANSNQWVPISSGGYAAYLGECDSCYNAEEIASMRANIETHDIRKSTRVLIDATENVQQTLHRVKEFVDNYVNSESY